MSRVRCPRRWCNAFMDESIDSLGRVSHVCKPCARNALGRCRDCPRPLTIVPGKNRPLRCPDCRRVNHNRATNARRGRLYRTSRSYRRAILKALKDRYYADAAFRAKKLAAAKAFREKNPRTDIDRALNREYSRRYRQKQRAA